MQVGCVQLLSAGLPSVEPFHTALMVQVDQLSAGLEQWETFRQPIHLQAMHCVEGPVLSLSKGSTNGSPADNSSTFPQIHDLV